MGRSRLWNRRQQGKVWGVPVNNDVIYWKDYPLALSGFTQYEADDWTITNPDSATLRCVLDHTTGGHAWNKDDVDGLGLIIPTPISAFCPPGIEALSTYRTIAGIRMEYNVNNSPRNSFGAGCGIIKDDGSGIDASTMRVIRHTYHSSTASDANTVIKDSCDDTTNTVTSIAPTAMMGNRVMIGPGIANCVLASYLPTATFNSKESQEAQLVNNAGSGTILNPTARGTGYFNMGETWDAGADKWAGGTANAYFLIDCLGTGTTTGSGNQLNITRIQYFVHSVGDWRY
tara:strand:- start:1165 stop:2025 length:861 start_codon:yes stop_codon:yes gene_type:complete